MSTFPSIDHNSLYRLPWSFSDNILVWLEPTRKCNLACEGCYRENVNVHKSLAEVRADLDTFNRYRKYDSVSIAGGDPLLHPDVVRIVEMVAGDHHKPVINTNGLALTPDLVRSLKSAGLTGFTFHVDSKQGRPGWRGKNERDLNALRLSFADMVHDAGGLSVAFNATVYEDTLEYVPDLVAWAQEHIDKVNSMVFIAYREAVLDDYDHYRGGEKINPERLVYSANRRKQRSDLTTPEVVAKIRERFPEYRPAAYLGGTEKPDSLKWLVASRFGTPEKIMGYAGPRMMEVSQLAHHAAHGSYFAYVNPSVLESGRSSMAGLSLIDPSSREAFGNWLRWVAEKPQRALEKVHVQSLICIQPVDMLPDGRQNMCDGCPDVTVYNGELVWSCRLEECLNFGGFIQTVPKKTAVPAASHPG